MGNVLTQLSDGLAATVDQAAAGVVRVGGRRRLPATGIIWSADGVIVSANHVVSMKRKSKVALPDGRVLEATVVGRDPSLDVAVLKVDATGLTPLPRVHDEGLKVGHLVLALGQPGESVQATLGIISALGDSWTTGAGGAINRYLQTDVVMYPGFSGGPLVNAAGELIALNSSMLARGVTVSLPTSTVERVVNAILAHGNVQRGYLGVRTQVVRLPDSVAEEVGQETGVLIAGVEPQSPAEESGLLLGDTIITFADKSIRHTDDLLAALNMSPVDQKAPVKLLRGGSVQEVSVKVGSK